MSKAEVDLESLPFWKLKSLCKEAGLKTKSTDKKTALITMLRTGETIHVEQKKQPPPTLEPRYEEKTVVPVLPDVIKPDLEALARKGLKWDINEKQGTIRFTRDITVTCNLDCANPRVILNSARDAFAAKVSTVMGVRDPGEPVEWRR